MGPVVFPNPFDSLDKAVPLFRSPEPDVLTYKAQRALEAQPRPKQRDTAAPMDGAKAKAKRKAQRAARKRQRK